MLALAAGLVAGCGGDDEQDGAPIPQQAAVDLQSRLDEVERRMEAGGGACADIQNDTLPAVSSIIDSLPGNLDPDVRASLERSFERLFQLTQEQCDEQEVQETDTAPEPLPAPETDTETTETLPPEEDQEQDTGEELPPEEVPPEEVPPEEAPPEEGGEGGDGEAGQGGGGGAIVPGEDG